MDKSYRVRTDMTATGLLTPAPKPGGHGTAAPFGGSNAPVRTAAAAPAAQVAHAGARSTDLTGSPSRGAPV